MVYYLTYNGNCIKIVDGAGVERAFNREVLDRLRAKTVIIFCELSRIGVVVIGELEDLGYNPKIFGYGLGILRIELGLAMFKDSSQLGINLGAGHNEVLKGISGLRVVLGYLTQKALNERDLCSLSSISYSLLKAKCPEL